MFDYQDGSVNDSESYLNDTFYSSNSIDNYEHARNFRNSVILPDMSRDASYESGLRLHTTNLHEFEEPQDPSSYRNDSDIDETETKTLKVTASPSLSALSGILSEKAKRVEQRMSSNIVLEQSIEEEELPSNPIEPVVRDSPNLIDMGGSNDNNFSSYKYAPQVAAHHAKIPEQPDFLTTPKLDPPTPRVEPADSDFPQNVCEIQPHPAAAPKQDEAHLKNDYVEEKHAENPIRNTSGNTAAPSPSPSTSADLAGPPRPTPKKQASSIRSFSGMSMGSRSSVENSIEDSNGSKKRKNIFSFLKRKPQKSASFVVLDSKSNSNLPTSSTFSVPKTNDHADLPASNKLAKKSHSNGSIFNSFRKNKTAKKEAVDRNLRIPKQRSRTDSAVSTNHTGGSPVKRDVRLRKPTPLDFEQKLAAPPQLQKAPKNTSSPEQKSQAVPNLEHISTEPEIMDKKLNQAPTNLIVKTPPSPEPHSPSIDVSDTGRTDFGEVLFPKSLSAQEVESIVSLERSRSVKSNKRNSLSSHRRSFTDNMSNKAHNGGMFITEPAAVKLSTPDLSKSPTSSILRNGTFDSLEFSPQKSSSRSQKGLGNSGGAFQPEERDFSFTSIEQKLNDLTLDSESQEEKEKLEKSTAGPLGENYETDFMSDIMEFASIIDFDKDLDLNLDLDHADTTYRSLNPSEKNHYTQQTDDASSDSFNFEKDTQKTTQEIQSDHDNHQSNHPYSQYENNKVTNRDEHLTKNSASPLREKESRSDKSVRNYLVADDDDDDDDDFEGENFNQLEEPVESEGLDSPTWQSPLTAGRPLSLSFKGLRANQLNSNSQPSVFQTSPTNYTGTGSFDDYAAVKTVTFSTNIILYATYTEDEYDRHPEIATCNQLTPQLAQMIKDELNSLKSEMEVHEDSRCFTHFY
ncbi:LANO_0C08086g1_1 [Lachancea nothofagi CBS 11611]|uniref:LANO_0C08086g1_1 n=1 Tax=Lachancea nothofagi CBS 11611 TaxID=1266666 RepID=A0A1G4J920_9SACH|nr:LANO_0C08086g1_1 [Lachancea nothofagi CBS 11611]